MTVGRFAADSARKFLLKRRVQGLGVRPAIARLASQLHLAGYVLNTNDGVVIHIQGSASDVAAFESQILAHLPLNSTTAILESRVADWEAAEGFQIRKRTAAEGSSHVAVDIPTDLAMCSECRRELSNRDDRRFEYGLSSCTQCGPRYSIIRSMPFERDETWMAPFELCERCEGEFSDPLDRRFHAQTIACPNCGPRIVFESSGNIVADSEREAVVQAANLVRIGGVLALKGLGGYQLICDATNSTVVRRLRSWKNRDAKPLAVMVSEAEIAEGIANRTMGRLKWLREEELAAVQSSVNPIVIVTRDAISPVCAEVNPCKSTIGIFLPTTPLHALLIAKVGRPLVVTSGNLATEPLAFDHQTAVQLLSGIANGWLHHDRKIARPIDDSVVRIIAARPVTLRAARGIAPLPLSIQSDEAILAVGAHQKVAIAISNGRQAVLCPHIGDMDSIAARQRFVDQVGDVQKLYGCRTTTIAHDLHPDYFTTLWASEQNIRTIAVQHHHAHVVAGMTEHGMLNRKVLGLAFDGTGYGSDGTIWGGEFLLASVTEFRRVAHVMPFALPGGDLAAHEPWRIAVSLLTFALPDLTDAEIAELINSASSDHSDGIPDTTAADAMVPKMIQTSDVMRIRRLMETGKAPMTSSMGRLFDGVASIVLGITRSSYEGESAMLLEEACGEDEIQSEPIQGERGLYPWLVLNERDALQFDWRPLVISLIQDRKAGVARPVLATRFHRTIAKMTGAIANKFPSLPIVLSGGCFQNKVLTEMIVTELKSLSREVATPGMIPPNDGGLAAGQLAIAAANLNLERTMGAE